MKQILNLKLAQQLTLTPQLKQSLRLLQLPSLDLDEEIQQTLDSNPLLERIENDVTGTDGGKDKSSIISNEPEALATSDVADNEYEIANTDTLSPEQDLSTNWQDSLATQSPIPSSGSSSNRDEMEFTQFISKQETLFEHVYWQIQMTSLSEKDKLIAQALLRSLDDNAYLRVNLDEVSNMMDPALDVEIDEIAAVLSLIKTLEPIGVGACSLSERLLMLLKQHAHDTPGINTALTIVDQHLDLLGSRNIAKLKKQLGVSDNELTTSLSLITQLNPRITNQFQADNENYVIPDLIITKSSNDKGEVWVANINPDNQNKLRVNETYSKLLKSNIDKEGSDYIQHNLIEAKTFIKSLMNRYDTLLLVGQAIVERQQAFFEHGAEHMQPMVLQDIADELDMHESTISRATSGKYLLSPRGVVELKYFFSSSISNTDGATSSSTAIRSLIKKMVASESKIKPLSDNKIAKELEQQGHIVARRTVAKYREGMNIAPSSQRKSLV